jgi:hypothetical protein
MRSASAAKTGLPLNRNSNAEILIGVIPLLQVVHLEIEHLQVAQRVEAALA